MALWRALDNNKRAAVWTNKLTPSPNKIIKNMHYRAIYCDCKISGAYKKAQGCLPCAFSLLVCDKARDTVHENVFRF